MPGSLSVSTPSSHLPPKKILHSSGPTSPPQTPPPPLPPPYSHPPSASWTAAVHLRPRSPARPPGPRLAKSQHQSLTAHSDPLWSKTLRALWRFWATPTAILLLSGAQWWVRVVSVGEVTEVDAAGRVVAAGATAAPGCWSWWRMCRVIWTWQHSATRSSSTSTSWLLQTVTHCSWYEWNGLWVTLFKILTGLTDQAGQEEVRHKTGQ